eukprot:gene6889-8815_t
MLIALQNLMMEEFHDQEPQSEYNGLPDHEEWCHKSGNDTGEPSHIPKEGLPATSLFLTCNLASRALIKLLEAEQLKEFRERDRDRDRGKGIGHGHGLNEGGDRVMAVDTEYGKEGTAVAMCLGILEACVFHNSKAQYLIGTYTRTYRRRTAMKSCSALGSAGHTIVTETVSLTEQLLDLLERLTPTYLQCYAKMVQTQINGEQDVVNRDCNAAETDTQGRYTGGGQSPDKKENECSSTTPTHSPHTPVSSKSHRGSSSRSAYGKSTGKSLGDWGEEEEEGEGEGILGDLIVRVEEALKPVTVIDLWQATVRLVCALTVRSTARVDWVRRVVKCCGLAVREGGRWRSALRVRRRQRGGGGPIPSQREGVQEEGRALSPQETTADRLVFENVLLAITSISNVLEK